MTPAQYIEAARVPRHMKPWKDGNRNFKWARAYDHAEIPAIRAGTRRLGIPARIC